MNRKLEFQQIQEKRKRACNCCTTKIIGTGCSGTKRKNLPKRELAKQQQQNLLLQKQSEIDKLHMEADKKLLEQKLATSEKLALKEKEKRVTPNLGSLSPESIVVELPSPDMPPPSQNWPRPIRKPAIVIATEHIVQESPTSDVLGALTSNMGASQVSGSDYW